MFSVRNLAIAAAGAAGFVTCARIAEEVDGAMKESRRREWLLREYCARTENVERSVEHVHDFAARISNRVADLENKSGK